MSQRQQVSSSFSYHTENQQPDLQKQMLILQRQYEILKNKYSRLKDKYHQKHSDDSDDEVDKEWGLVNRKEPMTEQEEMEKREPPFNSQLKSYVRKHGAKINDSDQNLSEQFSWNQQTGPNVSQTSQNFAYHSSLTSQLNYSTYPKPKKASKDDPLHSESSSISFTMNENSDNFEFSQSINVNSKNTSINANPKKQETPKKHQISQKSLMNDSDNIEFCLQQSIRTIKSIKPLLEKQPTNHQQQISEIFVYGNSTIKSHTESQSFSYTESSGVVIGKRQKGEDNSENIQFSLNDHKNGTKELKHDDLANSNNFTLNESEILHTTKRENLIKSRQNDHSKPQLKFMQDGQESFEERSIPIAEENLMKMNHINTSQKQFSKSKDSHQMIQRKTFVNNNSSMKSYEGSGLQNNNQQMKYKLKDFSFQLPDQINEPIEINSEDLKKHQLEPIIPKPKASKPQPKKANNSEKHDLTKIKEDFNDEFDSDEEEREFYFKLISKLNMKKKISTNELKRVSSEMNKLAQQFNDMFEEIYETGTYEMKLMGSLVDDLSTIIPALSKNNTVLITQMTTSNTYWQYDAIDHLFKTVQFPSIKAVTIKLQDLLIQEQADLNKVVDKSWDVNFLRYFGLCKKITSLSLKGETLTEEVARSIVDLDFPSLKSLYIGFEAPLSDEVVDILTCHHFRNLPKSKIYIATWEGQFDKRFTRTFGFKNISFITLETDNEDSF